MTAAGARPRTAAARNRTLPKLEAESRSRGVVPPVPETLKRYGWTMLDWLETLAGQGWQCPICEKAPASGRFVTDHEHVRLWKQMPADRRRLYVRGITCWPCNRHLLPRGMTAAKAERAAAYLARYAERRPK